MAITFNKSKPKPVAPPPPAPKPVQSVAPKTGGIAFGKKPIGIQTKPAAAPQKVAPPQTQQTPVAKSISLSFVKKGAQAQQTIAQEDMKAEQKAKDNMYGFYLPNGKETQITFLDGEVKEGMLDIPFFYQHSVFMNGSYNNHFICTNDDEPCPICEGGDTPSFVGLLTIIDHSEFTSKKDGKVYKDNIKKFVAKRNTIKLLLKKALKHGGLTGVTFDVSRTGEKEPSVGNQFDYTEKRTLKQLQSVYGSKEKIIKPIAYEEYLKGIYLPAAQLRKLGFGASQGPIGGEAPMEGDSSAYDETM